NQKELLSPVGGVQREESSASAETQRITAVRRREMTKETDMRVRLGDSRPTFLNAHAIEAVAPNERMEVSVALRRNNQKLLDELTEKIASGDRSIEPLSREEFTRQFGATTEDRALVKQFASEYGLGVNSEK